MTMSAMLVGSRRRTPWVKVDWGWVVESSPPRYCWPGVTWLQVVLGRCTVASDWHGAPALGGSSRFSAAAAAGHADPCGCRDSGVYGARDVVAQLIQA